MSIPIPDDLLVPDPRAGMRASVNDIAKLLRGAIDKARNAPAGTFTREDAKKIAAFLAGQVERAAEELARIAANDPGAFVRFDFDMPLAAPETKREARPFVPSSQMPLRPIAPLDAPVSAPPAPPAPGAEIPLGRLTGRRGIVRGTPPAPPPMQTDPVHGVTYLDDKETTNG